MNLFQRNNNLQSRWASRRGRKGIFLATLAVCIIILVDAFSGGSVRTLTRAFGAKAWSAGVSAGNSIFGSGFFTTRRSLIAENVALSEQIARLQERAAAYQVLKNENSALRDTLRVAQIERGKNRDTGITAPIISSFRASPYGTFEIGAGTADSIGPGDLVLSAENFVIGRVEAADENSSLVRGIFAPDISTDAVLRGVGVEVLGQGGGNARTDVPRQTDVSIGDPVVSAVLGSRAIGIVGKVTEDSGNAYKRVQIYLPVNLSVLQFVYVVKK